MQRHIHPEESKGIQPDDQKPDVYEERFNTIVDDGFIALGIALGHNVGLFKALTELTKPETSDIIAQHANVQERYAREWLFSMVAAKIVFITEDNKYYIPENCKEKTKRSLFSTLLPAVAPLTSDLEKCFKAKEMSLAGYDFSKLEGVMKFSNEDRKNCDNKWLEENLLPLKYKNKDEINDVLDIGCGSGRITIAIAKYFPNARVIGIDPDKTSIEVANANKAEEGVSNVEFHVMYAEEMKDDWTRKFDWVSMFTVLHDLPNPDPCIAAVLRVLKDDGAFTALDPVIHSDPKVNVGNKTSASSLALSCYVCLPCSLSEPPAVGFGQGWGLENRAKYLRDKGFEVHGDELQSIIQCTKAKVE